MQYHERNICGHYTDVRLYGPGKDREAALRRIRDRPCAACLRAITTERADSQQQARELPALIGSDKQVTWAHRLRYHALTLIDRVLRDADPAARPRDLPIPDPLPGETGIPFGETIQRLYEINEARWWIDHARDIERAGKGSYLPGVGWIDDGEPEQRAVARLLWAAAGIDADRRYEIALAAVLSPRPDVLARRTHSATLDAHIARSRAAIRSALRDKQRPYVAVSGGKDSAVVMHLVLSECPDATLFWSDDELEYPESVAYLTALKAERGDQLVTALGWAQHAGWFTPWQDRPFWRDPLPGTLTAGRDADDWMASRGHDLTFTGVRAEESKVRDAWLSEHGPTYAVKRGTGLRCCPIWDWPVGYVYQYLEERRLPINAAYARLAEIGVPEDLRRVGPLPLARRDDLAAGWPDMYERLVDRYGQRWR